MNKFILFIILYFFTVQTIFAQTNTKEEYILEADKVTRIGDNLYEAEGNVVLKAKGLTITSKKMIYNSATSQVQAEGSVSIENPEQKLEAEKINYVLDKETGTAENIQGFIAPFNYLCAKTMNKTGPTTFTVKDAKISACSGSVPEWSLSMYEGSLDIDGYMQMNHTTANIYDSPFIYVPKFFYPVSSNRKTGFLIPLIGYSQDMGAIGNIKYYIAPDINYDFTIGLGLYSERGVQEQFEARYAHDELSYFYAAAEHIKDFNSEADTQSRWRATLKNQYVPVKNLYINLNGDYVSDYLYSRDYHDYSIPEYNGNNYQNMYFAELKVKYYNDFIDSQVYYRRDMLFVDTLNGYTQNHLIHMPSIRVNKIIKDIPYIFFEYDLAYDRLYYKENEFYHTDQQKPKQTQDWVTNRFSALGRLYTPIDLKVLTLTPSAYVGYIRWQDSTKPFVFENSISPDFGGIYRESEQAAYKYWGGVDATLAVKEIYKDYGLFRHSIQNNLVVSYSPKLRHPENTDTVYFPNLVTNDITSYQSILKYEFITALVGSGWDVEFKIDQGYDFMDEKSPVLPLNLKLKTNILDYVTNTTEMTYKHSGPMEENEPRIKYFNSSLTFKFLRYFFLRGTYTYNGDIYGIINTENTYNTSTEVAAGINIWRIAAQGFHNWSGYNSDMSFNNLYPKSFGASLLYNAECWSLGLRGDVNLSTVNSIDGKYHKEELRLYLLFSLKGLGDTNIEAFSINHEKPI